MDRFTLHSLIRSDSENEDDQSDIDSKDDSESLELEEGDSLAPCRIPLGLTVNYCQDWTTRDAFREFYQNWKDGIIETFKLNLSNFRPEVQESNETVIVRVHCQASGHRKHDQSNHKPGDLLGFIRFLKKKGTLELTNFKSKLTKDSLNFGESSKRKNRNLAGTHGEGMKVATVVMLRTGHQVRLESTGSYWNFSVAGRSRTQIYCRISPMKSVKLSVQKKNAKRDPKKPGNHIWEDVSIKIGRLRGSKSVPIDISNFKEWVQVSTDLICPSKVIETTHGNLILDENFRNKIYLKGLLLANGSAKDFKFAYNVFHGGVNRDRQRLTNPHEEARALTKIWQLAIEQQEADVLAEYVKMLRDDHKWADVEFAEDNITKGTAKVIWQYLIKQSSGKLFYYGGEDAEREVELIEKTLKKVPRRLPKCLWTILESRFNLVRTVQEQRVHLFQHSPLAVIMETPYSTSVKRALSAALALDVRTKDLELVFKSGDTTRLDLLLGDDGRQLMIHEKWLNFQASHHEVACQLSRLKSGDPRWERDAFYCDHVIDYLYDLVLTELPEDENEKTTNSIEKNSSLRLRVSESLKKMPRMIQNVPGDQPGEIEVSWTENESIMIAKLHESQFKCQVTLHRESTCSGKKFELFEPEGGYGDFDQSLTNDTGCRLSPKIAPCGCPEQVVPQKDFRALFQELKLDEEYFPMVSRKESRAFFGLPPKQVRPNARRNGGSEGQPLEKIQRNVSRQPNGSTEKKIDRVEYISPFVADGDDDTDNERVFPPSSNDDSMLIDEEMVSSCPDRGSSSQGSESVSVQENHLRDTVKRKKAVSQELEIELWKNWKQTELRKAYVSLAPTFKPHIKQNASYLENAGGFQKDRYYRATTGLVGSTDYIFFVHRIVQRLNDDGTEAVELLISKYSSLSNLRPCVSATTVGHSPGTSEKELLLHFRNFSSMGQEEDAEVVNVKEIIKTEWLPDDENAPFDIVEYRTSVPKDVERYTFFCRFAIQSRNQKFSACFAPIRPHLLPRRFRHISSKAVPRFKYGCKPVVVDLSPHVLGLAEGFAQASCEILAGLGFNTDISATWKSRCPSSRIYDGENVASILTDLESNRLSVLPLPGSDVPKIVVISGTNNRSFILSHCADQMASRELFAEPLESLAALTKSTLLSPDYILLTISIAVLHEEMIHKLKNSIFNLLEQRFSVHLENVFFKDHASLQERVVLTLLASPYYVQPGWSSEIKPGQSQVLDPSATRPSLRDIIGDLSFKNPRTWSGRTSFVCGYTPSTPTSMASLDQEEQSLLCDIYNHQTGHFTKGTQPIQMDSTVIDLEMQSLPAYSHPDRGDDLTIRELARLQGFPDDFVFYDSDALNYRQVHEAFPPPIAKMLANTIIRTIQPWLMKPLDDVTQEGDVRGTKRPRC